MIPADSEYYAVVKFALDKSLEHSNWKDALKECEEKYHKYNWIHAYPNACAEVIALWYGNGDYEKTLHIITMAGIDVDCNAAQIMGILGIQQGLNSIPKRLIHPAFDRLVTYLRSYEEMSLDELVEKTTMSIITAKREG